MTFSGSGLLPTTPWQMWEDDLMMNPPLQNTWISPQHSYPGANEQTSQSHAN